MKHKYRGFTLIEILIVVAIIGILATVVMLSLSGAQAKSRDARRISDITGIKKTLGLYYTEKNSYPTCGSGNATECGFSNTNSVGQIWNSANTTALSNASSLVLNSYYNENYPTDPKFHRLYDYLPASTTYAISVLLEVNPGYLSDSTDKHNAADGNSYYYCMSGPIYYPSGAWPGFNPFGIGGATDPIANSTIKRCQF
ncbi:MAG: prepilin-type N-terminal cleavage/methylation domain-containing protein [Patescibacteria group bacterium]|nr:prepilin-type N-terminal cleavage/methylation domain-containing protein [Patescibacteria group bacterium]